MNLEERRTTAVVVPKMNVVAVARWVSEQNENRAAAPDMVVVPLGFVCTSCVGQGLESKWLAADVKVAVGTTTVSSVH